MSFDCPSRFANRSSRFADAYDKGLDGKWAAYAVKIYHGHRTCPETLWRDMEKAGR
jgi:hypothetical protein